MWWLGFWQTARHAHWWLSADVRLPDRADPLAVGSIELDRLTEPLAALAAALPGLVATERAALVDVDRRIADTVPRGDDPASTASAIATRIELLGDRAVVLGAAARRAWTGAMVDPAGNLALFRELGGILLPQELRDRLRTAHAADTTLVVAPGPGLSGVPWELLVVDDDHDVRLVERATVLGGVSPAMLVNLARPASRAGGGRAVRVVDPTAAGSRTGGGRIYPDGVPEAWRSRTGDGDALLGAGAAGGCSPAELSAALQSQEWSRLVFVGHASATDPAMPTSAGLELAGDGETGDSRLTAGQWLRDPTRWPAPRRVGFVACQSDDAGYTEQIGLTLAALNAGARTVVATRWSLPSDGSERLVAGGAPIGSATTALALAVDAALGTTDPVGAIGEWQRDRLACWRSARSDAARRLHAPLVWSALVTYDIPDAAVSAIPGADDQPVARRPAPGAPRHDALRVPPAGDAAEVAKASLAAGVAAFGRADWQEAREHYLVALAAFTACGDLKGVADATTNVGNTAYFLGDLEEAADRYRAALPLYRDLGLDRQVAVVGQNLGNVSFQRGELDVAAEQYRAAAEALLRGDFRRHAADTLVNLGAVLIELGRPHVALGHLDQAGALYRETCDESELGGKLAELDQNTGLALAGAKSFERARAHLLSALRHWQSDEPSAERAARANHNLGLVAFRAGDLPEAQLRYARALEHFHTVGNEHEAADARLGLGTVARHRGDVRAARSNFRQAQEHYRRTGQWLAYAQAAFNEGLTHPGDSDRRFDLLAGAWAAMQSMSWRLAHVSERAAWRAALDHANDEVLETARLGGRDRQFAELLESLRIAGTLRRVAPTPLSPSSLSPSSQSPTSLTPAGQEEADRDSPFVEPLPSMTLSAGPVVPWAASSAADEAPCDAPPWIDCGWPPTLVDAVARAEEIVAVAGATTLPLRRGAVSLIPLLSRHPEEEGPGWTDRAPGSTGPDAD
ncbi:tetratricopeptide repeat protein [Micromonospora sp. WMMD712]|uniref:CHAT domain-containing tetratricopeptide repeat protein n=1 Tax=Micromonospora sp. WMMD712 TaxID=3016096 RepID=UPI00249A56F0|nr:tetratricopeptide repeat protein [Micromonospora sp. WMMD712]WFE58559.1 CHAT domain-containing protein [Micromonospora sp. WMMD712]